MNIERLKDRSFGFGFDGTVEPAGRGALFGADLVLDCRLVVPDALCLKARGPEFFASVWADLLRWLDGADWLRPGGDPEPYVFVLPAVSWGGSPAAGPPRALSSGRIPETAFGLPVRAGWSREAFRTSPRSQIGVRVRGAVSVGTLRQAERMLNPFGGKTRWGVAGFYDRGGVAALSLSRPGEESAAAFLGWADDTVGNGTADRLLDPLMPESARLERYADFRLLGGSFERKLESRGANSGLPGADPPSDEAVEAAAKRMGWMPPKG